MLDQCTPGPWAVYDRGIGFEVHGPDGRRVNDGFRDTFENPADAHLIAASREMYAALAALYDVVMNRRVDVLWAATYTALQKIGDAAWAALCKARGESRS